MVTCYKHSITQVWFNITVVGGQVSVDLLVFGKQATRLPEAMFLRYNPKFKTEPSLKWRMQKFGEDMDPLDVIVGGSKKMHSINNHVSVTNVAGNTLYWRPRDSSLICFGPPSGFPIPTDVVPDISHGKSSTVFELIW